MKSKLLLLIGMWLGAISLEVLASELLTKAEMSKIHGQCLVGCYTSPWHVGLCAQERHRQCYGCDAGQVDQPGLIPTGRTNYTQCVTREPVNNLTCTTRPKPCVFISLCKIITLSGYVCDPNSYSCIERTGGVCTTVEGKEELQIVNIYDQTCE